MIEIALPGFGDLRLEHLVMDYNGTLALDGLLAPGVAEVLRGLAGDLTLRVVTADTFGLAREGLAGLPCELTVLPEEDQAEAKRRAVTDLGAERVAAVGNGRNDRLMLAAAGLGIAVSHGEGAAAQTLSAADVVCPDILTALHLLRHPRRLVATLRG